MNKLVRYLCTALTGLPGACADGADRDGRDPVVTESTSSSSSERNLGAASNLAERLDAHHFDWKHRCTAFDHEAPANVQARALLPGDTVDGSLVTDTDFWTGIVRRMRQFNGRFVAVRLQPALLDQVGIGRVRQFIEEMDLLYAVKKEIIGLDPDGSGPLLIVAIPAEDDPCAGGYACAYLNTRRIQMWTQALTDDDGISAINHELNHAFDRLSSHLFTDADAAHSWTEVLDTLTLVHLQRDGGPRDLGQGLPGADYLRYNRFDRWSQYLNYPGASWDSCIDVPRSTLEAGGGCDPIYDPDSIGLSVHAQAGAALSVFELFGTDLPLKRWLAEAHSLATSRGYAPNSLTFAQRSDFLVETLSHGAQANLSCFFDTWNWPVSSSLRTTLTSLYGTSNGFCADADGDGFSPQRGDCNDSDAAIRPTATETVNGVDDDCSGIADDRLIQEMADFPNDQSAALVVPFPVHIKGTTTTWEHDSFRIDVPTARTVRLYFRGFGPWHIVDLFHQGSRTEFTALASSPWSWRWYRLDLAAGVWDFRVFGYDHGAYELFLQPDTSRPVELPDGNPITYTPAPAGNPSGNQYVIPAPPLPPALAGTPGLQVRHWISGFGFVGTAPAGSPFTWHAPAGTNPKALQYRSQFVTTSTGPPAWPLSQVQSLLPSPTFASADVGNVSSPGGTRRWFDNFRVEGGGSGITGSADSFRYAYVRVSGDADIVARVVDLENTSNDALAGVAIRETLAATARSAVMAVTPSHAVRFLRRTSHGGLTATTSASLSSAAPRWVRLQRSGNAFRAHASANGTDWTPVGSATSITMPSTVYVGVAVTSANSGNAAIAHVDAVGVTGGIVP